MKLRLAKQPEKYISKTDSNTRKKLECAIDILRTLSPNTKDIKRLEGFENKYRLTIYHYRILFEYDKDNDIIIIENIGPRGDIYKRKGR